MNPAVINPYRLLAIEDDPVLGAYLQAQLQRADLMILGGLNEGSWPGLPSPDPWLAPGIRRRLGLPGLETRIGLAAHDFAGALAAKDVILTRAERDGRVRRGLRRDRP